MTKDVGSRHFCSLLDWLFWSSIVRAESLQLHWLGLSVYSQCPLFLMTFFFFLEVFLISSVIYWTGNVVASNCWEKTHLIVVLFGVCFLCSGVLLFEDVNLKCLPRFWTNKTIWSVFPSDTVNPDFELRLGAKELAFLLSALLQPVGGSSGQVFSHL